MFPSMNNTPLRAGAAVALGLAALVAACAPETGGAGADAVVETADQKASYAVGLNVGQSLEPMAERIDVDAVARGLRDAFEGAEMPFPEDSLEAIQAAFDADLRSARQEQMQAEAAANRTVADSFLTANAERDGVITTDSGLQYEVIEQGDGARPGPEDRVTIHYHGTLPDGTVFDSSVDRGEPATFGVNGVIAGFSEGLQLMTVGSKYRLYIPPELGYGERPPSPAIPPNATLIFDLELLEIAG